MMKMVAITACHTGIAHCYMATAQLTAAAKSLGISLKVETQGAMGIENRLSAQDIQNAEAILLVTEVALIGRERYAHRKTISIDLQEAIRQPKVALKAIQLRREKARLCASFDE